MKNSNQRIVDYYETLHEAHGCSPLASDYGSHQSQRIKFQVLGEVADYSNKSVLDVGCGFATFSEWLDSKYSGVEYHGVDITPTVTKAAAKMFPQHSIECRDILANPPERQFDIVTANGIFYLVRDEPAEFQRRMIATMFELCNEAVAVNTLSTWADVINESEFYASPTALLDFCRSLAPRVTLRHDYMGHDFTVYLYKRSFDQ